MGKRGRPRNSLSSTMSHQNQSITLREEKTGKSANKKNAVKFNDRLKLEHLENLASWAAGEANIPSLAAFYGRRLAAVRESLGVPPNHSSLFHCERCETVLRPGTNCTVAAKKNKTNEKSGLSYTVYSCHFCSHGNLKRETSKQRYSKETRVLENDPEISTTESNPPMPNQVPSLALDQIQPVGPQTPSKLGAYGPAMTPGVGSGPTLSDAKKMELSTAESNLPPMASKIEEKPSPVLTTPGVGSGRTLLDTKKRKRKKPSGKKTAGPRNGGDSEAATSNGKLSERNRQSWANGKPIPFSL